MRKGGLTHQVPGHAWHLIVIRRLSVCARNSVFPRGESGLSFPYKFRIVIFALRSLASDVLQERPPPTWVEERIITQREQTASVNRPQVLNTNQALSNLPIASLDIWS